MSNFHFEAVEDFNTILLIERHIEATLRNAFMVTTKTEFGEALGVPAEFPTGRYYRRDELRKKGWNKGTVLHHEGDPIMIRTRDIINKRAWEQHLLRPTKIHLPPGFSIIVVSLFEAVATFGNFMLRHTARKYRDVIPEQHKNYYNAMRGSAIWESMELKIAMEKMGRRAFALPEIYPQIMEGKKVYEESLLVYQDVNKRPHIWKPLHESGYTREEKEKAREQANAEMAARMEPYTRKLDELRCLPLPSIDPLPMGIPSFRLLEEVPDGFFKLLKEGK